MRGLTLAEILISLFILLVAVLGLIGVRLFAAKAATEAPSRQTASLIAASQVAEVEHRLRGGASPEEVSFTSTPHPEHPEFDYEVSASNHPAYIDLVLVDVVVEWSDRDRRSRYKLHTRFTGL